THGPDADQDQDVPLALLQGSRPAARGGHLRPRLRQLAARHAARGLRREGVRRRRRRRGSRPQQLPFHPVHRRLRGAQARRRRGGYAGVNLELTAEQRSARDGFRAFVAAEIAPHAGRWDREEAVPPHVIGRLRELTLLGSNVAPEFGGRGRDMITYGLLTEEIAKGCSSVRSLLTVHDMVAHAIQRWGSREQKEKYLPRMARGELLGALALSEPNAGSDAKSIETTAADAGD